MPHKSGLPQSLISNRLGNVSTIIAMQYTIQIEPAQSFAENLYEIISKGFPIDTAIQMVREEMLEDFNGTRSFATPVLFMQAKDGFVFDRLSHLPSTGTRKITFQQKNKIHETVLYKIELLAESHKKILSNDSTMSLRDLWQSEGRGNLFQILTFFQKHMDLYSYRFGSDERKLIDRLLQEVPVKLDELDTLSKNGSTKDHRIYSEILGDYSGGINMLSKLIESDRKEVKRTSVPQQGISKEQQALINILSNFYNIMDLMGTLRMGLERCIELSMDKDVRDSDDFEKSLKIVATQCRNTTYNDFRMNFDEWAKTIMNLSRLDNSHNVIKEINDLDNCFNNICVEIDRLNTVVNDLRRKTRTLWNTAVSNILVEPGNTQDS